jgi:hypothetical protein
MDSPGTSPEGDDEDAVTDDDAMTVTYEEGS